MRERQSKAIGQPAQDAISRVSHSGEPCPVSIASRRLAISCTRFKRFTADVQARLVSSNISGRHVP